MPVQSPSSLPVMEVRVETVVLPKIHQDIDQLWEISAKQYSTEVTTWSATYIRSDGVVVQTANEDFDTTNSSVEHIVVAEDVLAFALSEDYQVLACLMSTDRLSVIRIDRGSRRDIELHPKLAAELHLEPNMMSHRHHNIMAISKDGRIAVFFLGDRNGLLFICFSSSKRSSEVPSWVCINIYGTSGDSSGPGTSIAHRFIMTEEGTSNFSLSSLQYSRTRFSLKDSLRLLSVLVRPPFSHQPDMHIVSRQPVAEFAKQIDTSYSLKASFGNDLGPNMKDGSIVSSCSNSGSILAFVLNQDQTSKSATFSKLAFSSLLLKSLVVCKLDQILSDGLDVVTDIAWMHNDTFLVIICASGHFAIFSPCSGPLFINTVGHFAIQVFQPVILVCNRLALHPAESVILCYNRNEASHVVLRSLPPPTRRMKTIISHTNSVIEDNSSSDTLLERTLEAARLLLSAWGIFILSAEPMQGSHLKVSRQLARQTVQLSLAFREHIEIFCGFMAELRNLLGFPASFGHEMAFSFLLKAISYSLEAVINGLIPAQGHLHGRQAIEDLTAESLMQLFEAILYIDATVKECLNLNDKMVLHGTNLRGAIQSHKFCFNDTSTSTWYLPCLSRLNDECNRLLSQSKCLDADRLRDLGNRIQAMISVTGPPCTSMATLASFCSLPGVFDYLSGNFTVAFDRWSDQLFAIAQDIGTKAVDNEEVNQSLLRCLYGLVCNDRTTEAAILSDCLIVNVISPLRKALLISESDRKGGDGRYIHSFAAIFAEVQRINLLKKPLVNFVGNFATLASKFYLKQAITVPPPLHPSACVLDDNLTAASSRMCCLSPDVFSKLDAVGFLSPSKLATCLLLSGRYDEAIRLASAVDDTATAIAIAVAADLLQGVVEPMGLQFKSELSAKYSTGSQSEELLLKVTSAFQQYLSAASKKNVSCILPHLQSDGLLAAFLPAALCRNFTLLPDFSRRCLSIHFKIADSLVRDVAKSFQLGLPISGLKGFRLPPVYCNQVLERDATVDESLQIKRRRLASELLATHFATYDASLTTKNVVRHWYVEERCPIHDIWARLLKEEQSRADDWHTFFDSVESPASCLGEVVSLLNSSEDEAEYEIPQSLLSSIVLDFDGMLITTALWHIADELVTVLDHFFSIRAEPMKTGETELLLFEERLLKLLAMFLPFALLSAGRSGCITIYDSVVQLARRLPPKPVLSKLLAMASALVETAVGQTDVENITSSMLEPLFDEWRSCPQDQPLSLVYASELGNYRRLFVEFAAISHSKFLPRLCNALLGDPILVPVVANVFHVRILPVILSGNQQKTPSVPVIGENWGALMSEIIVYETNLAAQQQNVGVTSLESLVKNYLKSFKTCYVDHGTQFLTSNLANDHTCAIFRQISDCIRDNLSWKPSVYISSSVHSHGGSVATQQQVAAARAAARVEEKRGDSSAAEFYRLLGVSSCLPQLAQQISLICRHVGRLNFGAFMNRKLTEVTEESPGVPTLLNIDIIVHAMWLRLFITIEEFAPKDANRKQSVEQSSMVTEDKENKSLSGRRGSQRPKPSGGLGAGSGSVERAWRSMTPQGQGRQLDEDGDKLSSSSTSTGDHTSDLSSAANNKNRRKQDSSATDDTDRLLRQAEGHAGNVGTMRIQTAKLDGSSIDSNEESTAGLIHGTCRPDASQHHGGRSTSEDSTLALLQGTPPLGKPRMSGGVEQNHRVSHDRVKFAPEGDRGIVQHQPDPTKREDVERLVGKKLLSFGLSTDGSTKFQSTRPTNQYTVDVKDDQATLISSSGQKLSLLTFDEHVNEPDRFVHRIADIFAQTSKVVAKLNKSPSLPPGSATGDIVLPKLIGVGLLQQARPRRRPVRQGRVERRDSSSSSPSRKKAVSVGINTEATLSRGISVGVMAKVVDRSQPDFYVPSAATVGLPEHSSRQMVEVDDVKSIFADIFDQAAESRRRRDADFLSAFGDTGFVGYFNRTQAEVQPVIQPDQPQTVPEKDKRNAEKVKVMSRALSPIHFDSRHLEQPTDIPDVVALHRSLADKAPEFISVKDITAERAPGSGTDNIAELEKLFDEAKHHLRIRDIRNQATQTIQLQRKEATEPTMPPATIASTKTISSLASFSEFGAGGLESVRASFEKQSSESTGVGNSEQKFVSAIAAKKQSADLITTVQSATRRIGKQVELEKKSVASSKSTTARRMEEARRMANELSAANRAFKRKMASLRTAVPSKQEVSSDFQHSPRIADAKPARSVASSVSRKKSAGPSAARLALEHEADLAKPKSDPSSSISEEAVLEKDAIDDAAIKELLDRYSVSSESVSSVLDWDEVDAMAKLAGSDK